jgi:hypothetical protein
LSGQGGRGRGRSLSWGSSDSRVAVPAVMVTRGVRGRRPCPAMPGAPRQHWNQGLCWGRVGRGSVTLGGVVRRRWTLFADQVVSQPAAMSWIWGLGSGLGQSLGQVPGALVSVTGHFSNVVREMMRGKEAMGDFPDSGRRESQSRSCPLKI